MLALASTVPDVRTGFHHEFKWDGVRAMVEVDADGQVVLFARSGNDITAAYPELREVGAAVGRPAVLDGEVVALGEDGRPSFEALQRRMHLRDPARVAAVAASHPVVLMLFDLLELDGRALLDEPYERRRELLAGLGLAGSRWQTPAHHDGDPQVLLEAAAANGLEGIVAKRAGSPYRPGTRSDDWRKVRLVRRQEFVVGGAVRGEGSRAGSFGALLVGYYDAAGDLRYAGSVGSGFTDRMLRQLQEVLERSTIAASPFADPVPRRGELTFVEPRLVVEVQFSEWTREAILRQPSFKGVRTDKAPAEVVYRPGTPEGPPVRDTGA
ncbi:MAG TPA: non-homologous end-joining DNA ligase [Nitriliruptorales bacterium]